MILVDIPGYGRIDLAHLVLDFNGTLATDGVTIPGVNQRLAQLSADLDIHIITADTFGTVRDSFAGKGFTVAVLGIDEQDKAKLDYVNNLGAENTAAIGNGRNDALMLKIAKLGIAVIGEECAAFSALNSADIAAPNILCALDLLLNAKRLTATLRS